MTKQTHNSFELLRLWLPVIIFIFMVAGLSLYQVGKMEAAPLETFLQQLDSYPSVGGVVVWLGDEGTGSGGTGANWVWPVGLGVLVVGSVAVYWHLRRRQAN